MDGTRGLRHVRHHLRGPPGSAPHPHLERLRQLSLEKRLPPARYRRTRRLQDRDTRRGITRKLRHGTSEHFSPTGLPLREINEGKSMHYRPLGRTGWNVSEVSFGAWA